MATKPTKGKTIAEQKAMDTTSNAMIFEGASLSQLSRIFSQDIRKVKAKLHGLLPTNSRGSHPIYNIGEAARYLVQPLWPIEEYVKHMNHADLPTLLSKEYWAGVRSKQLVMKEAGDLWHTDKVIDMLTEIYKTVSIPLRLADDTIEREVTLSNAQRLVFRRLTDEILLNVEKLVREAMTESKNRGAMSVGSSSEDTEDYDDEI